MSVMRKIASEMKHCVICMKQHEVDTVEVMDTEIFKDEEVSFRAIYEYCSNTDEYLETEDMIRQNSLAMKDAYRQTEIGNLNAEQISARKKPTS